MAYQALGKKSSLAASDWEQRCPKIASHDTIYHVLLMEKFD